jgi:hypothetical protein
LFHQKVFHQTVDSLNSCFITQLFHQKVFHQTVDSLNSCFIKQLFHQKIFYQTVVLSNSFSKPFFFKTNELEFFVLDLFLGLHKKLGECSQNLDTLRLKLEKLDTDKQGLHFFLVPKQLY